MSYYNPLQASTAMTTTMTSLCLMQLLLLGCLGDLVHARTLLLSNCSVDAHTHEMRRHYSGLRESAVSSAPTRSGPKEKRRRLTCQSNSLRPQISGDTEVGVKLLDKSWITSVQVRFWRSLSVPSALFRRPLPDLSCVCPSPPCRVARRAAWCAWCCVSTSRGSSATTRPLSRRIADAAALWPTPSSPSDAAFTNV